MTDTIADIDGIGTPKSFAEKAQNVIDASGITRNLWQPGALMLSLRSATNQAEGSLTRLPSILGHYS